MSCFNQASQVTAALMLDWFGPDSMYRVMVQNFLLGLWIGLYLELAAAFAKRAVAQGQLHYVLSKRT